MCHVTAQSCCLSDSQSSSERLPLFRRCSSMCTNMIKRTKAETEDRGEEAALLSSKHQRPCGHPGFSRPHHSRGEFSNGDGQSVADCRALCARYRAVKLEIAEGKKASSRLDSESFDHVFGNVEHLYSEVSCPRGQIADAQALFDLTVSLLASVKDIRSGGGQTASEIVTAIIKNFGRNAVAADEKIEPMIDWEKLGHEACAIFSDVPGMITMLGPMESQPKPRKTSQRRLRDRIVEGARPEELQDSTNNTTETDKNMETMFNVLRRSKVVYLEDILLNRNSFSQTVENIFALSFLVKDGRAKIFVDKGRHLVGPMNFPSQQQRERGEGLMHQFVFRFDFKDWQVMKEVVEERTELMPHRERVVPNGTRGSSTRVREVSRNRARGTDQLEDAEGKAENEDELPKRKRKTMVGSLL